MSNISRALATRGLVKRAYSLTQKISDNPQNSQAFLGKLNTLVLLKNARKTDIPELQAVINNELTELFQVFKEACEKDRNLLSKGYELLLDTLIEAKEISYIEKLIDGIKNDINLADTLLIHTARRLVDDYDEDGDYIENKDGNDFKEALKLIEKTSRVPNDLENQYLRIETLLSIVGYFFSLQDFIKVRELLLFLEESALKRDMYSQITHLGVYWMHLEERGNAINLWKKAIESTNSYNKEQIKSGNLADYSAYVVTIKAVKDFDETLAYQLVDVIDISEACEYVLSLLKRRKIIQRNIKMVNKF